MTNRSRIPLPVEAGNVTAQPAAALMLIVFPSWLACVTVSVEAVTVVTSLDERMSGEPFVWNAPSWSM
jgi:hypothetical protein